jgi:hypothetical protein
MGTPRLVRPGNQKITNHGNRGRRVRVQTGRSRHRDLLLQADRLFKLHVRNAAALDGVARCTCKAAAVFDSAIQCKPPWSEATAQLGDRACTSPKVAVGLDDGTVHFVEVRWNEV